METTVEEINKRTIYIQGAVMKLFLDRIIYHPWERHLFGIGCMALITVLSLFQADAAVLMETEEESLRIVENDRKNSLT